MRERHPADTNPPASAEMAAKAGNLTAKDFQGVKTREQLMALLDKKGIDCSNILKDIEYEHELILLQTELVKLQQWIAAKKRRVAILFEGRDAAGKGGAIRRFIEHLNPRSMRVVALTKPNELEKGQWYFRRYVRELPNPGEMVFFDRSWYNRAVVEPVMGFCNDEDYRKFLRQVPEFEHMLYEDGVYIIKFWFSISKDDQRKRFDSRRENPLKQWKLSPVDERAQEMWDQYTHFKEQMFSQTHTSFSPWIIVKANDKKAARLESIRYVLSQFDYQGKEDSDAAIYVNPDIISRFHRSVSRID